MKAIKIILVIIFVAFLLSLGIVRAADQDLQKGAELYWQATRALNQKNFTESQAKFEEAAQYLSGKLRDDALQMAEFVGKMSSEITAKMLLKNDRNFSIIGEAKKNNRVWHFYTTKNESLSILHLSISGKKPLDDLVGAFEPGTFTKKHVIENRDGYLSKGLSSMPGSVLKIRMWYCDKDNTTNIAYENFPEYGAKDGDDDYIIMSETFEKGVSCSSALPISPWLMGVIIFIILAGVLSWHFKLWQKIKEKFIVQKL